MDARSNLQAPPTEGRRGKKTGKTAPTHRSRAGASNSNLTVPNPNPKNRKLIAREYLRTWFIVDFVSTVPLDTIFSRMLLNSDALRGTKLIRMIRLIRLFKIFRLLKVCACVYLCFMCMSVCYYIDC